jgi:transposase
MTALSRATPVTSFTPATPAIATLFPFTPVGVDIAKASFTAAILTADGNCLDNEFSNSPRGFNSFVHWLRKQKVNDAHVLMEATGELHLKLATYLYERQWFVSVVNPSCTHNHAKSQLKRNKTDWVDARIIAHYCKTQPVRMWTPKSPEEQELQSLTRRLEELKADHTRESNRLSASPVAPDTRRSIRKHIDFLDKEIESIEKAIATLLNRCEPLAEKASLLQTIPGIGKVTAAVILAEIPDLSLFDSARQLAAYAGVTPTHRQSGQQQKRSRLSKQGNRHLRTALYMAGLSARHHNPLIIPFADRLAAKGKQKMSVLGAAMRKLLHIVYGVLKSGKPFDPTHLPAGA